MNGSDETQWKRREGYGGPESFPEDELAAYAVGHSKSLAGQEYSLYLSDGRVLHYTFKDDQTLIARSTEGGHEELATDCTYSAAESAPGIFFLKHGYNNNERLTTCLILDLNKNQVAVIDGEVPAEGDKDFRVRNNHVGGCIGKPTEPGDLAGPPFPTDLVGKHLVAQYSERYAWELIYINETKVTWHGLKGNPGIGDTEDYIASAFQPGVYAISWSEEAETLAAVFLYNFTEGTITGHMWGYAPDFKKLIHAPMGGKIVDPQEYGLRYSFPGNIDSQEKIKQKNIDVVLRAHHEVWNKKKYDLIPEIYAEDYEAHFICGMETRGQDGVHDFIKGHHESFPDWMEKVVDIIAEGDRVVTRYISTATHEGEFQGIAPTGKEITINEVSIHRVLNGKIVEQWGFPDGLSHIQQLTEG